MIYGRFRIWKKVLKLWKRCNDVKDVNKGYSKKIIFIIIKNVYNTVHMKYYLKIEKMKIRSINILKVNG